MIFRHGFKKAKCNLTLKLAERFDSFSYILLYNFLRSTVLSIVEMVPNHAYGCNPFTTSNTTNEKCS